MNNKFPHKRPFRKKFYADSKYDVSPYGEIGGFNGYIDDPYNEYDGYVSNYDSETVEDFMCCNSFGPARFLEAGIQKKLKKAQKQINKGNLDRAQTKLNSAADILTVLSNKSPNVSQLAEAARQVQQAKTDIVNQNVQAVNDLRSASQSIPFQSLGTQPLTQAGSQAGIDSAISAQQALPQQGTGDYSGVSGAMPTIGGGTDFTDSVSPLTGIESDLTGGGGETSTPTNPKPLDNVTVSAGKHTLLTILIIIAALAVVYFLAFKKKK